MQGSKPSCLMYKLDIDELRTIAQAGGVDTSGLSAESLAKILDLPQCRDICLEQSGYALKYDDWYADQDLRDICAKVGIKLP